MSQGRGYQDPYQRVPPGYHNNQYIHRPTMSGEPLPSNNMQAGNYGSPNGNAGQLRHSMPSEPHKHTNGRSGHSSLPPQNRVPPSQNDIATLQSRLRNMLSSNDSPTQQKTYSPFGRGRGGGTLYNSPPLRRGQPPQHSGNRNGRPYSREGPTLDKCEDITAYALSIVKNLEIPEDERREKEEFCNDLEEIVQRIRPTAKVELFGSFANTFTIANSDIDCCVTDPKSTSDLLQQSGLPGQLQKELDALGFETTLLLFTRVPILKIFRPATNLQDHDPTQKFYKYPLQCDVGWQNRLALHNTRLLSTYSHIDPRVRQIVLFVKYWTKTRGIAQPRYGTLCSYGYVLMILYYLTHIAQPPVLPNLQCMPTRGVTRLEDVECEGCNIYFSRDANGWKTQNTQSIGELIKGFFDFYAFEWYFKLNVISIRSPNGMITKESKGWTTLAESTGSQSQTIKSRYLIAIEDPFELSHNVARTVNHRGLFDIRGEFIRAAKMLNAVSKREKWLTDVCIERLLPERPLPHRRGQEEEEVEELGETVVDTLEIGDGEVRVTLPPVVNGVKALDAV